MVQGFNCDECENEIAPFLKKVKGLKKWTFDDKKFEYTMTLADTVADHAVVATFEGQGYRALVTHPDQDRGRDPMWPYLKKLSATLEVTR